MKFDTKKQLEALELYIKQSDLPCVFYAPCGAGKSQILEVISKRERININERYAYGDSLEQALKCCIEAKGFIGNTVVSVNSIDVYKKIKSMKVVNCFGFNRYYPAVSSFISERLGG